MMKIPGIDYFKNDVKIITNISVVEKRHEGDKIGSIRVIGLYDVINAV